MPALQSDISLRETVDGPGKNGTWIQADETKFIIGGKEFDNLSMFWTISFDFTQAFNFSIE